MLRKEDFMMIQALAQRGLYLCDIATQVGVHPRLWRCEVCRPIEGLAADLQKAIGRDLTDDERRRFGVPDFVPGTK